MKLRAAAISLILAGSVQAYEYQQEACYRRLGDDMRADNTFTFQTPYLCMRRCGNLGLNYAALRGVECFCGSEKPFEKYEISLDNCDTPCAGWEKEICGGYKAWSLYSLDNDLDVYVSSSTTAPSSTEITSNSTSGAQSTAASESDAVTTSSAGMSNSASMSLWPAESTKIMFSASSQAASTASTTPSSYSPSVLGSSSLTAVIPTSSSSGANRRYSFLF